ncbi:MAG: hypothetical protein ACPG4Q_07260 [Phycisphaeraceae bacterium]|jgi:hypothetical protein
MTMGKWVFLPLTFATLGIASLLGYQWAKATVAQDIYRDRLTSLQSDYQQLAEQYNQAITPRPVTELLVEDGTVCVVVRRGDGELVRVPTTFNAWEDELFVDYALVDGRLLIRRVFDEHTAARSEQAVVIDPELVEVDWEDPTIPFGKAIYRSRMADGRWIISVTGDGSLGLKQIAEDSQITLAKQPEIKKFEPVDERADEAVGQIGVGDVWEYLTD